MRERLKAYAAFAVAAFLLAGIGIWVSRGKKAPPVFRIASVDSERLSMLAEAGGVGTRGSVPEVLRRAIAAAAAREGVSLVLDQSKVVTGAIDLTGEVARLLKSGNLNAPPPRFFLSHVGVVNQRVLFSIPVLKEARARYAGYVALLKKEYASGTKTGVSASGRVALKARYDALLSEYEKDNVAPLMRQVEAAIRSVGKQKGICVVFDSQDVLYGGIDITPQVKRAFLSGAGKIEAPETGEALLFSAGPGVVDENSLEISTPSFSDVVELDREISSWKSGAYGVTEVLLSPDARARWVKDCREAAARWRSEVRSVSASSSPDETVQDEPRVEQAETYFARVYGRELSREAARLQKKYAAEVDKAEKQTKETLKAHAARLVRKRNETLLAFQSDLLSEARRRFNAAAARLQAADVASGKDPGQDAALRRKLLSLRDQELDAIKFRMKKKAVAVDGQGMAEMKAFRARELARVRASLGREQDQLRLRMKAYRSTALRQAREDTAARFGIRAASVSSRYIMARQAMEPGGDLARAQQRIWGGLRRDEQEILSRSPAYRKAIEEIRKGHRAIVPEVLKGLAKERSRAARETRREVARRTWDVARKYGIETVLTGEWVNVGARDLTAEVAGASRQ